MTLARFYSSMHLLDDHIFSVFECYRAMPRDLFHIALYIPASLLSLHEVAIIIQGVEQPTEVPPLVEDVSNHSIVVKCLVTGPRATCLSP
jgi:hypothetical protein